MAKFLSRRYSDPVKRENLILTCGASHGLQLLLNTILSPNGIIFVEEVTYMSALDAFGQFPLMKIVAGTITTSLFSSRSNNNQCLYVKLCLKDENHILAYLIGIFNQAGTIL